MALILVLYVTAIFISEAYGHGNNECRDNYCSNGGTCISRSSRRLCRCPTQFYGDRCQFMTYDANICDTKPCQNHGTCIPGFHSYDCVCKFGYYGQDCEIELYRSGS